MTEQATQSAGTTQSDELQAIRKKLDQLGDRIKNTSHTRFSAGRRVRFNYDMSNLTVVVLSLWTIAASVVLVDRDIALPDIIRRQLEAIDVILPVFVVVFSLLEGGGNFLRSYQLEHNARQLRELSDKLAGEAAKLPNHSSATECAMLFERFSSEYNDCLERSPINHDDIDHLSRKYDLITKESEPWSFRWYICKATLVVLWGRRQAQRTFYLTLWLAPFIPLSSVFHHSNR